MKTVLFIFGTRPEAIKLAPLVKVFEKSPVFDTRVCVTAQHREMLDQVLEFFDIRPDYDLNLMKARQTLFQVTANGLTALEPVFDAVKPDLVFVQGDTTTVMVGALAAFYKQVKVGHIEAGLRSHDKHSPFPEEINRVLTSRLTDFHFVPTTGAKENLLAEGISENIHVVGNTVIDALLMGLEIVKREEAKFRAPFEGIDLEKRTVLITCHRRESHGEPFENICRAFLDLATAFPETQFIYPVHLNPNIKEVAHKYLSGRPNIHLLPPLAYPNLIWLMHQSYLVLTDSGGIQEEAPSLGKPVLVMREVTERMEGVAAGTAKLVGTDRAVIVREATRLLSDAAAYEAMSKAVNPYGDGTASEQILAVCERALVTEKFSV